MKTKQPIWARTLIEAGKAAVFLASLFLFLTFVKGVIAFHPGALLVLGMLLAFAMVILFEYWHDWRRRDHT